VKKKNSSIIVITQLFITYAWGWGGTR
jgi:hypothetical protein